MYVIRLKESLGEEKLGKRGKMVKILSIFQARTPYMPYIHTHIRKQSHAQKFDENVFIITFFNIHFYR